MNTYAGIDYGLGHLATFAQAHDAFVPADDDNPDCIPFYRMWHGLKAAWGSQFADTFNGALHRAACEGSYAKTNEERYRIALVSLKALVADAKLPEEPRYQHYYGCLPDEPTEQDARAFFNQEYKRAFPGRRANSKDANVKWAEKREQAMAIVRQRYEDSCTAYRARESEIEQGNTRYRQEWFDKLHSMALLENAVREFGR